MKLKDLIEQYGDYEVSEEVISQFEKPKPKSVWELTNKDEHYSVNECGFIKYFNFSDFIGYKRDIGNVFTTEEEAEKDLERRRVETLLIKHGGRRWFKNGKENWFITFNRSEGFFDEGFFKSVYTIKDQRQGTIYFDTEEQLKKAFAEIGEERLKKALFEVR